MDPTLLVPIKAVLIMTAASVYTAIKLPRGALIPLQWDLRGRPLRHAGKFVALSLAPILAIMIFAALALTAGPEERDGLMRLTAVIFVPFHLIHLWFAAKSARAASRKNGPPTSDISPDGSRHKRRRPTRFRD